MDHGEEYTCNFPSAYGRSILTEPWFELGGSIEINCQQTGYSSKIEFLTKVYLYLFRINQLIDFIVSLSMVGKNIESVLKYMDLRPQRN